MSSTVIVVEAEHLSRIAIAHYLREAGYRVFDAVGIDDALTGVLARDADILLCNINVNSTAASFRLASWIRTHRPNTRVILKAGTWSLAEAATELCGSPDYTCADHIRRITARFAPKAS